MAAKPNSSTESVKISKELNFRRVSETFDFFSVMGSQIVAPQSTNENGFYDTFLLSFIKKVDLIQRGRISCTLLVKAPICNGFGTLHGGSVGSMSEILCTACARTVVAEDKQLFLGGITISYLSAIPINEELIANASLVKSGRNLSVVAVEFRRKKTGNLLYTSHATFYNMPPSSL